MKDKISVKNEIILELALNDETGLSNSEIAEHLGQYASNTIKIYNGLKNEGLLIPKEIRRTKETKKKKAGASDRPHSLVKDFMQISDLSYLVDPREIRCCPTLLSEYPFNVLFSKAHRTRICRNKEEFADALNKLIEGPCLYDKKLFKDVTLRQKTKDVIRSDEKKIDCLLLNRLLLEDALPSYLERKSVLNVFFDNLVKDIIYANRDDLLEQFLSSQYISSLIDQEGFFAVFSIVEEFLERKKTSRACSVLLRLSPTGKQFKEVVRIYKNLILRHPAQLDEKNLDPDIRIEIKTKYTGFLPRFYLKSILPNDFAFDRAFNEIENRVKNSGDSISLNKQNYWAIYFLLSQYNNPWNDIRLNVLSKFDSIVAVDFCRTYIFEAFEELFKELGESSTITQSMLKFLEHDVYLSPLTSYPFNNIRSLLFYPPFQRIHEDIFILGLEDCDRLVERARVIFECFSDFLLEDIRAEALDAPMYTLGESDPILSIAQEELAAKVRGLMFYWNAASTFFDIVIDYLTRLYDHGSGKYYLKSNGSRYDVIDLETDKLIFPPDQYRFIGWFEGILPREIGSSGYMKNPFEHLRPCASFGELSKQEMKAKTFERIFSDLKSKLAKEKEEGFPINIDWV